MEPLPTPTKSESWARSVLSGLMTWSPTSVQGSVLFCLTKRHKCTFGWSAMGFYKQGVCVWAWNIEKQYRTDSEEEDESFFSLMKCLRANDGGSFLLVHLRRELSPGFPSCSHGRVHHANLYWIFALWPGLRDHWKTLNKYDSCLSAAGRAGTILRFAQHLAQVLAHSRCLVEAERRIGSYFLLGCISLLLVLAGGQTEVLGELFWCAAEKENNFFIFKWIIVLNSHPPLPHACYLHLWVCFYFVLLDSTYKWGHTVRGE